MSANMGRFELASDFVINNTLKPHVNTNFRVASPGKPLNCPKTGTSTYPKILTTGSGEYVHNALTFPPFYCFIPSSLTLSLAFSTNSQLILGNAVHRPTIFPKLISMTGKDKPNVVYIGTPFFDRDDKYDSGTISFRQIGCRIKRLMVAKECTTPSPEEMRRIIIDWADLIMVSGGNSLFAMLRWQSIGLDLLIKEAALKGTVMCGGSAGCGCWFDSMQTDSLKPEACKLSEKVLTELSAEERLDWSFVRISGMGYISAFCIPHIDTVGTNNVARADIAKRMLLENYDPSAESPIVGLGVDEKAAVVYEDGKITIMSAGTRKTGIGQATCHILFVNERNEVLNIPVTPNTGEAWTLEEMIERAKRSVEAVQSPLDLMVSESITNACHRRGCSGNIDMISIVDGTGVASATASATMGALERSPSIRNVGRSSSVASVHGQSPPQRSTSPFRGLVRTSSLRAQAMVRSLSVDGLVSNIEGMGLPSLVEGKRLVEPTSMPKETA